MCHSVPYTPTEWLYGTHRPAATALGWLRESALAGRPLRALPHQPLPERFPAGCGFRAEMPGAGVRRRQSVFSWAEPVAGLLEPSTGAAELLLTSLQAPLIAFSHLHKHREIPFRSRGRSQRPRNSFHAFAGVHEPYRRHKATFHTNAGIGDPFRGINFIFFTLQLRAGIERLFHIPTAAAGPFLFS